MSLLLVAVLMMQVMWCRFRSNLVVNLVKLGLELQITDEAILIDVEIFQKVLHLFIAQVLDAIIGHLVIQPAG